MNSMYPSAMKIQLAPHIPPDACQQPAGQQPEVATAMELLGGTLATTRERLAMLASRLDGVLRPSLPQAMVESKAIPGPPRSPLTVSIDCLHEEVRAIYERIMDLPDRLAV